MWGHLELICFIENSTTFILLVHKRGAPRLAMPRCALAWHSSVSRRSQELANLTPIISRAPVHMIMGGKVAKLDKNQRFFST